MQQGITVLNKIGNHQAKYLTPDVRQSSRDFSRLLTVGRGDLPFVVAHWIVLRCLKLIPGSRIQAGMGEYLLHKPSRVYSWKGRNHSDYSGEGKGRGRKGWSVDNDRTRW